MNTTVDISVQRSRMRVRCAGAGWNRRVTDQQLLAAYREVGTIMGACRKCGVPGSTGRLRRLLKGQPA